MTAKRHRVGKGKRRRHSLASIQALIMKAVESAARKGKSYRTDRRVQLLLREQKRLRMAQERNAPW